MDFVYLDNAATAFPKSAAALSAATYAFLNCGNGGRSGHPLSMKAAEVVYDCREVLAQSFGTEAEKVVLTSGATAALNIAIKCVKLKKGGAVCSAMEHNSVLRPLYSRFGNRLKVFTPVFDSAEKTADVAMAALKGDVALMVLSHASNLCGICLPVKELCDEARRRGIVTVLDCAQSAGHIPFSITELGADLICLPAHKGFGGAPGVGALIVNPCSNLSFKPFLEGGTGSASKDRYMPPVLPERLEAGTANVTGIAAFAAAVKEFAPQTEKEEALRRATVAGLKALKGVTVYATAWDGGYAPVVAFNVAGVPSERVAEFLAGKGIYVRGGLHCAPLAHEALGTGKYGAVRVSLGRHNTKEDVDCLLNALPELL